MIDLRGDEDWEGCEAEENGRCALHRPLLCGCCLFAGVLHFQGPFSMNDRPASTEIRLMATPDAHRKQVSIWVSITLGLQTPYLDSSDGKRATNRVSGYRVGS